MSSERQTNLNKDRKSDAQKEYERLDNEGRFAGDDADSKAAEQAAAENVNHAPHPFQPQGERDNGFNDEEAHRDPEQSQTFRVEAQNDRSQSPDPDLLDNQDEVEHARTKANQNRS